MPYRPYHKKWSIIAGVAAVAIMASFLIAAITTKQRRDDTNRRFSEQVQTDQLICERVNKLYVAIQQQVRLSIKNTPKIAYYKTHPVDLIRAEASLRRELAAFAPRRCPTDPPPKEDK